DDVETEEIGASPDGKTALIPNNSVASSEASTVSVVKVDGSTVSELVRLENMDDPAFALFSLDGQTALISQVEPGSVTVLSIAGARTAGASTIKGVGLAEHMAMVRRGKNAGLVLIPSIDPSDSQSNVSMLHIDSPGKVTDLGQVEIGDGDKNIPVAIAIAP